MKQHSEMVPDPSCQMTVCPPPDPHPISTLTLKSTEPHHLLAQIPLTVSPFISLPTAPTLPYTYKPLPSTLPPSSTADSSGQELEKYVLAPSGHTAHPDDIIASCKAIQEHIERTWSDAKSEVEEWEARLREEELAEKRRVAPGWLDREEKILQPNRASVVSPLSETEEMRGEGADGRLGGVLQPERKGTANAAGEELDRAFGAMGMGGK